MYNSTTSEAYISGGEVALTSIALIVIGLCVFILLVLLLTVTFFKWRKLCCFKPITRINENPVSDGYYDSPEDGNYEPYDNAHEVYRMYTDDGGSYWTFDSGKEMKDFIENKEKYVKKNQFNI